jgi:hypothetical protein
MNHAERLDRLAIESKKQCNVCSFMPKDVCVKWQYSRSGIQGVGNRAPWCQFFKVKTPEDEYVCPLCGKVRDGN